MFFEFTSSTWSARPRTYPRMKTPSKTKRCGMCHKFIHSWNSHLVCPKCQIAGEGLCQPATPCALCQGWDDSIWTLYQHAGREAASRTKRSLSFPGTPAAPSSRRLPLPGRPSPSRWPASQPSAWSLGPQQSAYQAFLLQQLSALQGPPAFPSGPPDLDFFPPGQHPGDVSAESELSEIYPLDR